MVKLKVSNLSVDQGGTNALPELELKSFIVKTSKDDQTFSESSIKDEYMILMPESEYNQRLISKSSRKSNPLLVNFEEYN